jgi:hypothetical protein
MEVVDPSKENPEFVTAAWPLVYVRAHGRDDDASVRRLLDGFAVQIRRGPCAIVLDTREVLYPALQDAQRFMRMEGEWVRDHRTLLERHVRGAAFVITNPAIRFLFSGVLLIASLPCPHTVTASLEDAKAFCHAQLRGAVSARPRRVAAK